MTDNKDTLIRMGFIIIVLLVIVLVVGYLYVENRLTEAERNVERNLKWEMLDIALLQKESLARIMMQIATAQKNNSDRIELSIYDIHAKLDEILEDDVDYLENEKRDRYMILAPISIPLPFYHLPRLR